MKMRGRLFIKFKPKLKFENDEHTKRICKIDGVYEKNSYAVFKSEVERIS